MSYDILWIALFIAILDWFAVAIKWKPLEYIAKPGVMLALLIWLWVESGFSGYLAWFALGLVFSLAGDSFLMLPREQFIAGLVSFLLGHLAYVIGFNANLPPVNLASVILAALVGLTAVQIYRRLAGGLEASGNNQLKNPVRAYSIVISLMLFSALLTLVRPEWLPGPALLVSSGALLFFTSDASLGWNKFVAPLPYGNLRVIISYHLGQGLLVLGASLHYMR